jgi:hypothetical protein
MPCETPDSPLLAMTESFISYAQHGALFECRLLAC